MLVRMPIVGSGKPDDPRTVMLPTWECIGETPDGQAMIVNVPSDDHPDDVDPPGTARRPIINGLPVLIGLTPAQRLKWREKLARRWQGIVNVANVDTV